MWDIWSDHYVETVREILVPVSLDGFFSFPRSFIVYVMFHSLSVTPKRYFQCVLCAF